MKIAVFTPTNQYGGLDVTWASLARQVVADEIYWFIADELAEERKGLYGQMHGEQALANVYPFIVPRRDGYPSNLTTAYIMGMEFAREIDADIFISLQDYIYLESWQVGWFVQMALEYPHDLGTGLCSIADNPGPEMIADPKGLYTIFDEPFIDRPADGLLWSDYDHRGDGRMSPPGVYEGDQYAWEMNWCYIPRAILHDRELNFDPEFDRGLAKDHHAYTAAARAKGARVLIDTRNHAIGLPHTLYFPKSAERRDELAAVNERYCAETYGL